MARSSGVPSPLNQKSGNAFRGIAPERSAPAADGGSSNGGEPPQHPVTASADDGSASAEGVTGVVLKPVDGPAAMEIVVEVPVPLGAEANPSSGGTDAMQE